MPNRRDALRGFAAGMAASLAACGKPEREIVPFVRMPERLVAGVPVRYATVLPLSGFGRGVVVETREGRPIKVEGNPRHPASGGATDAFAEADVLSLYDPDRSRAVLKDGQIASRDAYLRAIGPELARLGATGGAGLHILSGRVASPTLLRQLDDLLGRWPEARWHVHEPVGDEPAREGSRLAFGRPLVAVPRLGDAAVIVTLDADVLGPGPDALRLARGWGEARRPDNPAGMSRLYCFEANPSATGAKADHRIALRPALIGEVALALGNALGARLRPSGLPDEVSQAVAAAARELTDAPGRGLVLAGPTLSPEHHALVHWINGRVSAPVDLLAPFDRPVGREPGSIADLAEALRAGQVDVLLVLGSNPAYDAPGALGIADLIGRARFRVHAGERQDETARLSTWHLPVSHPLEAWSDLLSVDGTAAIAQPMIRPLFGSESLHEILAAWSGRPGASGHDLVRETWSARAGADDFEGWWRRALHDGVVPDGRAPPVTGLDARLPAIGAPPDPRSAAGTGLEIMLRPDPCLWDGRYGNNAWLQELPKPLSKQVWGNALALGPVDAERLGIGEGDVVAVSSDGGALDVQVVVETGHAPGCGSLTLGLGREAVGPVGNGVGANAFRIRDPSGSWRVVATVGPTGRKAPVLTTQNVVRDKRIADENLPHLTLADLADGRPDRLDTGPLPSLLPAKPRPVDASQHAWGMVIDAAACTGCNACAVACQAENNVPVVGPEEIAQGRQMHWLRIDVYDRGTPDAPELGFQPVPCMHCEHAPCEPVCPVAASVHDSEGLNVQVYNRCIGTRFCEANCPYKVRRFNFFGYADGQEYADLGLESYRAGKNPDVTVRARGVMEKCTYCVQRISRARRAAETEDRPMETDVVHTACQSACPTRAITFGDLLDPDAAVVARKDDPRHYGLLAHLGTRPRTTYLAEVTNPSPALKRGGA